MQMVCRNLRDNICNMQTVCRRCTDVARRVSACTDDTARRRDVVRNVSATGTERIHSIIKIKSAWNQTPKN
jgi:hypothetical protein